MESAATLMQSRQTKNSCSAQFCLLQPLNAMASGALGFQPFQLTNKLYLPLVQLKGDFVISGNTNCFFFFPPVLI